MKPNAKKQDSAARRFLYRTFVGRIVLKLLCARIVSKAVGAFLDSGLSKPLISRFVKKNNINLDDFYADDFKSFNDCFSRKIKEGKREVDMNSEVLVAPCDSLLSVYEIDRSSRLHIKGCDYTVSELLCNDALAEKYSGGYALVFRLCVNHYHRYIYFDSGKKGDNVFICGKLHTVRPIALETVPVFAQNCREYTVMQTQNFGDAVQIEVGALLVGKIKNHHAAHEFLRGEEKGTFLYGGSTIVLLLEKGRVSINQEFLDATKEDRETDVVLGQALGIAN